MYKANTWGVQRQRCSKKGKYFCSIFMAIPLNLPTFAPANQSEVLFARTLLYKNI